VGKTAIVEGLAERIASGKVPYSLKKKRVVQLDISSIVAGTKYRGEFEERMKKILDEVKRTNGQVILLLTKSIPSLVLELLKVPSMLHPY